MAGQCDCDQGLCAGAAFPVTAIAPASVLTAMARLVGGRIVHGGHVNHSHGAGMQMGAMTGSPGNHQYRPGNHPAQRGCNQRNADQEQDYMTVAPVHVFEDSTARRS
jgi:hypothetical protein